MPASAAPLCDELQRLRDVLAEHQLRPARVSYTPADCSAATAARPYGACAGLAIATCATDGSASACSPSLLDVERRRGRRPHDDAADAVGELAAAARQPARGELARIRDVGRQEQVERRPVEQLRVEVAGRSVRDADVDIRMRPPNAPISSSSANRRSEAAATRTRPRGRGLAPARERRDDQAAPPKRRGAIAAAQFARSQFCVHSR